MIRIKYRNPDNLDEFIIEELDDSIINIPTYCSDLHENKLCGEGRVCNGYNCMIWIEINGEFILAGI